MKSRVLCIAPYSNYHPLHGMWEMTILHALHLRGVEVFYYLCDGLSECCDIFRLNPKEKDCKNCMQRSAGLAQAMGMPFQWVGSMLTSEDRQQAKIFSETQPVGSFFEAQANDLPLGQWIKSSLCTYFREADLDQTNPTVSQVCRAYLKSGLLYALSCKRIIEHVKPEALLLFNARMAFVRIPAEIATRQNIPYYSHERGWLGERLSLNHNDIPMSRAYFDELWRLWGDIPLTEHELKEINTVLRNREHGKDLNWIAYSPAPETAEHLRQQFGIPDQVRVWGLFTSSEDEVVSMSDYVPGAFSSQLEWIIRTLAFIRRHPEIHLIIRVHPNTGGQKSTGVCRTTLRFFETLKSRLPANVTLVAPDDPISTYDIMAASEAGLVYISTCGLEMACRGKAVVCAGNAYYGASGVASTSDSTDQYDANLESLAISPPPLSLQSMQRAHRFFYASFFRADILFPLVDMPTPYTGKLAYSSLDELTEGREPNLDNICRMITQNASVLPSPSSLEKERTESDEITWFSKCFG